MKKQNSGFIMAVLEKAYEVAVTYVVTDIYEQRIKPWYEAKVEEMRPLLREYGIRV